MYFGLAVVSLMFACQPNKSEKSTAEPAVRVDEDFNKRFTMSGPGFTGSDATYSVALPDGRTVWIFGDTFIGTVTPEMTREKTDPMYIRNCFVLQDGDQMNTLHQGRPEEFKSMMIPDEVNADSTERDIWYWPGDAFVKDDVMSVFVSKFHQADTGMWGFKFLETELVQYSLPEIKEINKIKIPQTKESAIHFGHAVYEGDDYLYIYGLGGGKPHVARASYDNIASDWEFFDGQSWSSNQEDSKPMADVSGSEQFSVINLKDKYVLVTQLGDLSDEVVSLVGDTPYGPWSNQKLLFKTPVPIKGLELFTYNAIVHPQFTFNEELLISYNTNSMRLEDHFENAAIYRPRFMRVPVSMVLNQD